MESANKLCNVFITEPPDVKILKIGGKSSVVLSWFPVPDARIYNVAYKVKHSAKYSLAYTKLPTIPLIGLNYSTEYVVKVQVGDSKFGHGLWSKEVEFKTKPGNRLYFLLAKLQKNTKHHFH